MRALSLDRRWKQVAGAVLGVSALAFTVACNSTPNTIAAAAQPVPAAQSGLPVVVSCEPGQRTIVRPSVVNGAAVSQVECVASEHTAAFAPAAPGSQAAPVPRPAYVAQQLSQPVYGELENARVVPVSNTGVRRIPARQVIYDERPVRKTRSVAKSAIIIGSSAGAGAGVGAAIGGKKGALIGAAIGGGGATLWDQITRRK